ncbi:MAG: peptidase domain-containing ABC transporter [Acidobacteriota bacterium]
MRLRARWSQWRRRIELVQQTTQTDCGPACLAMTLGYFGHKVRLEEMRQACGVGRDGADARRLLEVARRYGLRGRGVRIEHIEDLQYLGTGSLLHWELDHFVVWERPTEKGALVVDPAMGRREVSIPTLERSFSGIALALEPGEDFQITAGRRRPLGRYLRPLLDQAGLGIRVIIVSLLLQVLALALPLITAVLVDRVVPRGDVDLLTAVAAGLAVLVLFDFLSNLVRSQLLVSLRTILDSRLTLDFVDHLVELPYAYFQRRSAGDLMMRLNSNSTIREILTSSALSGLLDGVLVSLYLLILFLTDASIAWLVVGLGALRIALFLATRRRHRDLMAESLEVQARSQGYQVQMLAGIETLKTLGAERRAVERWSSLFVDELNVSLARGRLDALFNSLLTALATASPLVILVYGTHLVLEGELSLGTMLALSALATGFLTPLSTLVTTAVQLQLLGGYLDRIDDVMETPRERAGQRGTSTATLLGSVCLESVSFRYGPTAPEVVQDVSVKLEAGSFVALVGPSGAGKSTLAHLFLGLYRPTSGRVLFDGQDLVDFDLQALRSQVGVVTQQPYLFGASIRQNISLGDPSASLERVAEAAKLARIHQDIAALPMGYDTMVADGGASLSGGQRQRLALARALLHRPALLLLDEATSNLDSLVELEVHRALATMECTRLVIAHRLSTVRAANQILVMEEGRVVERGSHRELVELGGLYAHLVEAQLEEG